MNSAYILSLFQRFAWNVYLYNVSFVNVIETWRSFSSSELATNFSDLFMKSSCKG